MTNLTGYEDAMRFYLWHRDEVQREFGGILDALKTAQQRLNESSTYSEHNEDREYQAYLGAMTILMYSSWKSLEYLTELFSLWVDIVRDHSGDALEDVEVQIQVLRCSKALLNAKVTWNMLITCSWTIAWALHLLCRYTTPSQPRVDAEDVNEAEDGYSTDIGMTRPARSALVFRDIIRLPMQDLLEEWFRLDAIIRRHSEAQREFVPSHGGRDKTRKVDISFASNRDGIRFKKSELIKNIRNC